jgi:hypothetical protein
MRALVLAGRCVLPGRAGHSGDLGGELLEFHGGTPTDTAATRHTTTDVAGPNPVHGIRASAAAATAAKREAVRCGIRAVIRTARMFTARGVPIAAISHAPKRRVSRSITAAGPPGVPASDDRPRPSRRSATGSAVSPSARHLAWRCR